MGGSRQHERRLVNRQTSFNKASDNVLQLREAVRASVTTKVRSRRLYVEKCEDTCAAARRTQSSKEVWGKIFGTIDTREKFPDKRLELAQHEWARMKANDSLECRNCHGYDYMDFTRQSPRAAFMHSTYLATNEKTCIDCHKGIAHRLPDVTFTTDTSPRQDPLTRPPVAAGDASGAQESTSIAATR